MFSFVWALIGAWWSGGKSQEMLELIDKYGRHERIRTADLYRVKNITQLIEIKRYRPHCTRRITHEFGAIGPLMDPRLRDLSREVRCTLYGFSKTP